VLRNSRTILRSFPAWKKRSRLEIIDSFLFEKPEAFETAIITLSPWDIRQDETLVIGEGQEKIRVTVFPVEVSDSGTSPPCFQLLSD